MKKILTVMLMLAGLSFGMVAVADAAQSNANENSTANVCIDGAC